MDPEFLHLSTERLRAGLWTPELAPEAHSLYGDRRVTRFLGGQHDDTVADTTARLREVVERNARFEDRMGSWPLFRRADGQLVGTAILKPLPDVDGTFTQDIEIGWHLGSDCWGRGYATEAGRALLAYGFCTLELAVLHAVVDPSNEASCAVARRLGMEELGTTHRYYRGVELRLFQKRAHSGGAG